MAGVHQPGDGRHEVDQRGAVERAVVRFREHAGAGLDECEIGDHGEISLCGGHRHSGKIPFLPVQAGEICRRKWHFISGGAESSRLLPTLRLFKIGVRFEVEDGAKPGDQ